LAALTYQRKAAAAGVLLQRLERVDVGALLPAGSQHIIKLLLQGLALLQAAAQQLQLRQL
jgi:hypothetical protein